MPSKIKITDYISPILSILADKNADRKKLLYKFLYPHRKLMRIHLSNQFEIEKDIDTILTPEWLKKLRGFNPADWQTVANEVYSRARNLLGNVPVPEIILLPSFGSCNGRVYRFNKKPILALSPDFGYCRGSNLKILIAHEYGHFLRDHLAGVKTESMYIYRNLFEEGFATHFSRQVYPQIPKNIIYMYKLHPVIDMADPPEGYLRWCKNNLELLKKTAIKAIKSKTRSDMRRFFQCGRFKNDSTPIRVGYYLGTEIIKMLTEEMQLKQIVKLKPSPSQMKKWLERLYKNKPYVKTKNSKNAEIVGRVPSETRFIMAKETRSSDKDK